MRSHEGGPHVIPDEPGHVHVQRVERPAVPAGQTGGVVAHTPALRRAGAPSLCVLLASWHLAVFGIGILRV